MSNNIKLFILLGLVVAVFSFTGNAQNVISSPYSKYGIGLMSQVSPGAYDAMGKVGYALQDPYQINFKNPASYVAFDSLSFIADVAFSIHSNTLKTNSITQKATYARPGYFSLGLPVTRHWRTSVGILPYSNLGYHIQEQVTLPEWANVTYSYEGEGGLIQLYWGNAFKVAKNFSLGLNVSYIFGHLNYMQSAETDGSYFFNSCITNNINVNGIYLSAGAQYFINIGTSHKLGLGVVYENTAYIWTKQELMHYNYTGTGTSGVLNDTVKYVKVKGNMRIPQNIGGGISYQYKDKLLTSIDVTWYNWKKYYVTNNPNANILENCLNVSAGLQFVPNASSSTYVKKIRLRIGAHYSTGYIHLNDYTIQDYGLCVGVGLPLKLFNTNSSIGILFEYGQMGTMQNELIREDYFRFSLHFTLQEKWYQRAKLN